MVVMYFFTLKDKIFRLLCRFNINVKSLFEKNCIFACMPVAMPIGKEYWIYLSKYSCLTRGILVKFVPVRL